MLKFDRLRVGTVVGALFKARELDCMCARGGVGDLSPTSHALRSMRYCCTLFDGSTPIQQVGLGFSRPFPVLR